MKMVARLLVPWSLLAACAPSMAAEYEMRLRKEVEDGPGQFRTVESRERWKPRETAVIVCDMWDLHHCKNAVVRATQLAPRMNALLEAARDRGSLIIHAPSSCMKFYETHPARKRAQSAPDSGNLPEGIEQWMTWIDDREEQAGYPIDHSDGGEDDDPSEHAEWAEKLKKMGRNPRAPWTRQLGLLEIDGSRDAITDSGRENWNLLEQHGIRNVILVGVHTNMCVLGRPFGLRQLAKNGKNVVLMRDLTDTMYNPAMPPMVSHFGGTDLIVNHIEKYVCPTVTSDQILGGIPHRFAGDSRKHIVFLIGEREYETEKTLPRFVSDHLLPAFRTTFVFADPEGVARNKFHGVEAVRDADLLFVSVRRRALPKEDLKLLRNHVREGKPVIGIRTASHAFSLRGEPAPPGHSVWEEWDAEVIGGNYTGHHGNALKTTVHSTEKGDHFLGNTTQVLYQSGGSLYINSPMRPGQNVLLSGRVEGIDRAEPLAWTFQRPDGGKTFYTSLGHISDFEQKAFVEMLIRAIHWCFD
tara:strand:+ start:134 stop:1711 length:1578 start_codon:yes stop_codon:yes gene_type:complete